MAEDIDVRADDLTDEAVIFRHILGPGTDVMQAVFRAYYSCLEMGTNGGQMTLSEYMTDKNISNRAFKALNLGQQWPLVSNVNLMDVRQDISFYFRIITGLNKDFYNKLPDIPKQLLTELKEQRNQSCHSNRDDTLSLEEKLDELEKLFYDLLEAFEMEFPQNSYLQTARNNLPLLLTEMRNKPVDLTTFRRERESFLQELQTQIILGGQKELAEKPEFLNVSRNPFSNLIKIHCSSDGRDDPVVDVFTSPWIQDGQVKRSHEIMLNIKDDEGQSPQVIIVTGQGGSGKSTLVYKIFREWQKREAKEPAITGLESIKLTFYVVLKHTYSTCLEDLLIDELLVNTLGGIGKRDVIQVMRKINVLFLLDGFDEMKQDCKSLIENIVSRLPKSRILLTTRSEYLKEAQSILQRSRYITLDLLGLDELEQSVFAKKVFSLTQSTETSKERMHEEFGTYLNSRRHELKVHLKLPLTLALLIFLWLEYKDTPEKLAFINTVTQLYRQLFKMLKEKLVLMRKLFAAVSEETVDRVFHELRRTAFTQVTDDLDLQLADNNYKTIITTCKSNNLCSEEQQTEFLSAFLICDVEDTARLSKREKSPFSFLHRTQMEYFSAEHVCSELKKKKLQLKDCLEYRDKRRYKEVLPFIAGVLSIEKCLKQYCGEVVKMTEEADVEDNDYNFYFHLINETGVIDRVGDISYDERFCVVIGEKLSRFPWELKPETLISGLNLLIHCESINVSELEIDCRINYDLRDLHGLIEVLEVAKVTLGERGAAKIDLSLHIKVHRSDSLNNKSDLYLYYFLPWTNIVKFTGNIGKDAVQHLSSCTNIDVKLSDIDTFNALMEKCKTFEKLKKLIMIAKFLTSPGDYDVCPLPRHKCEFFIDFHDVVNREVLERLITFVKRSSSVQKPYNRLGIYKSSLDYTDGILLFSSLQGLVCRKITVESTVDLTDEQEKNIIREALIGKDFSQSTFVVEWNQRKVVGWDASWSGR